MSQVGSVSWVSTKKILSILFIISSSVVNNGSFQKLIHILPMEGISAVQRERKSSTSNNSNKGKGGGGWGLTSISSMGELWMFPLRPFTTLIKTFTHIDNDLFYHNQDY